MFYYYLNQTSEWYHYKCILNQHVRMICEGSCDYSSGLFCYGKVQFNRAQLSICKIIHVQSRMFSLDPLNKSRMVKNNKKTCRITFSPWMPSPGSPIGPGKPGGPNSPWRHKRDESVSQSNTSLKSGDWIYGNNNLSILSIWLVFYSVLAGEQNSSFHSKLSCAAPPIALSHSLLPPP